MNDSLSVIISSLTDWQTNIVIINRFTVTPSALTQQYNYNQICTAITKPCTVPDNRSTNTPYYIRALCKAIGLYIHYDNDKQTAMAQLLLLFVMSRVKTAWQASLLYFCCVLLCRPLRLYDRQTESSEWMNEWLYTGRQATLCMHAIISAGVLWSKATPCSTASTPQQTLPTKYLYLLYVYTGLSVCLSVRCTAPSMLQTDNVNFLDTDWLTAS